MSIVSKLKKKAADLEQKKQFDRALQVYIELLRVAGNDIDDIDIPLYNRVGDILIRQNSASDALTYYEKAVDLYSERGFLNNAIALCNKILRQSPGRTVIYYKLGRISAIKGFKSDAKRNFLEYADRMEKAGKRDEAFRALKEFADLCPDQDDVRLMLAEHLARDDRRDEAIEQLQTLHAKLETEGRSAEARATLDRMKAIDPDVEPKPSGAYQVVKSNELIFLDVDDVPTPRKAKKTPDEPVPSSRAPQPDPAGATPARRVSPHAALDGLSLTFIPEDLEGATDAAPVDGFDPTVEDERITPGSVAPVQDLDTGRAEMTDLDLDIAYPSLVDASAVPGSAPDDPDEIEDPMSETEFAALELEPVEEHVQHRRHDLALPSELALVDLEDVAPSENEPVLETDTPAEGDLDAAIMSPLTRASEPTQDPVEALAAAEDDPQREPLTLEQAAAAALAADHRAPETAPNEDAGAFANDLVPPLLEDAPVPRDRAAHSLEWEDLAEAAAAHSVPPLQVPPQDPDETLETEPEPGEIDPHFLDRAPTFGGASNAPDKGFSPLPLSPDTLEPDPNVADDHRAPISKLDSELESQLDALTVERASMLTPPEPVRATRRTSPLESLRAQIRARPNDPRLRRRFAEALLDEGDRDQGLRELDAAMQGVEEQGDLNTARDIAHEILRLVPESVRHHQKCVEYAVRAGNRAQLVDAYVALADALFRSGQHDKAQAVYCRVLELEPNDPRAHHALDFLASRTPNQSVVVKETVRSVFPEGDDTEDGDPSFDELNLEDLDAEVAAAFQTPDENPDGDTGRPSDGFATPAFVPSGGEFVDLGAMLRGDQPIKSTRMVVGDAKPTGDEQADFEEMLRRFKQGVAANVDDEDFDSHYDLGVAYKEMGLIDDAIAQFQKALRSDTHRSRAYEALGQCFVEKRQYQVAATLLKRAVETTQVDDRVLVGSLYLLGYALEQLQRDREALMYFHRVFAVDVEFRDVANRIRALESQAAT